MLNSLGAEIQDRTRPYFGALVDSTEGGANQQIHLEMQPDRPSLADALRLLNSLKGPAAAKYGG